MRQEDLILLGLRLRELRRQRALTQSAVARLAGISRQHLSDIERGAVQSSAKVSILIATALGIHVEELSQENKINDYK